MKGPAVTAISSLVLAVLAVVAGAVLLGLHDLTADQFLAILVGAGIHVSSVTIPAAASVGSVAGLFPTKTPPAP